MTRGSRKAWLTFGLGLAWFYLLLWPLLGIRDGTLSFRQTTLVWLRVAVAACICFALYRLGKRGLLDGVLGPVGRVRTAVSTALNRAPRWMLWLPLGAFALAFPLVTNRYAQDVAINVLVVPHHPHFAAEDVPGFWAVFALLGTVVMVAVLKKVVYPILARPEEDRDDRS